MMEAGGNSLKTFAPRPPFLEHQVRAILLVASWMVATFRLVSSGGPPLVCRESWRCRAAVWELAVWTVRLHGRGRPVVGMKFPALARLGVNALRQSRGCRAALPLPMS